jgi:hypothetical protein
VARAAGCNLPPSNRVVDHGHQSNAIAWDRRPWPAVLAGNENTEANAPRALHLAGLPSFRRTLGQLRAYECRYPCANRTRHGGSQEMHRRRGGFSDKVKTSRDFGKTNDFARDGRDDDVGCCSSWPSIPTALEDLATEYLLRLHTRFQACSIVSEIVAIRSVVDTPPLASRSLPC